jgi:beta-lactamase class A
MVPQTPIPDPISFFSATEMEAAVDPMQRDFVGHLVKEIFLKHLVGGAIKKNEKQDVLTGVSIMDFKSGRTLVNHKQGTEHFAASINKLPVALLILEDLRSGALDMQQTMTWTAEDRRDGFGTFDQPDSPLQAPLKDVIDDLLNRSGNTAVRILVNGGLGGASAVNERWAAEPNLANTRLQPLDETRFFLGNSTPHDSLWAMRELMSERDEYSKFMKGSLAGNIFTDFGVRSQLTDSDYIVLVNKIGLLDDADGNNRHDVGIIYNQKTHRSYGYSFFTTAPFNETDPSATERADQSLKDMGRYLLRYAGARTNHQAQTTPMSLPLPMEERIRY